MADVYDQYGNRIKLTDERGRPVQLRDERGRAMHLTGVVTTLESGPDDSKTLASEPKMHDVDGTHFASTIRDAMCGGGGVEPATQRPHVGTTIGAELERHDDADFYPTFGEGKPGAGGVEKAMSGGAGGEKQQPRSGTHFAPTIPEAMYGGAAVEPAMQRPRVSTSEVRVHDEKTHWYPKIPDAMPGAGGAEKAVSGGGGGEKQRLGRSNSNSSSGSVIIRNFDPTIGEAMFGGGGVDQKAVNGGARGEKQQLRRSGSSSSSEDDGQGGRRRKKKGLMQKIKDMLPGQKNKEEKGPEMVYTTTTKISVTPPAPGQPGEAKTEYIRVEHYEGNAKKGKIKDKHPGR